MSWNYRLVCRSDGEDTFIELHEVYYNKDGKPWCRTEEPILSSCITLYPEQTKEECIEELRKEVLYMLEACKAPILNDSDIDPDAYDDPGDFFKPAPDTTEQTEMGLD